MSSPVSSRASSDSSDANADVWTLRGIDPAVRRRLGLIAKLDDVPVGVLANQIIATWLDRRSSRGTELDRATPTWRNVRRVIDDWATGSSARSFDELTDRLIGSGVDS